MPGIREEALSPIFTKFYLGTPAPFHAVVHRFTAPDEGDPHSHPWSFRSTILHGSYIERVYQLDGSSELIHRKPGDSFWIAATHIHRIEELPDGECWTLILPGSPERTSRFWQFRDDGTYSRQWNEPEFQKGNDE